MLRSEPQSTVSLFLMHTVSENFDVIITNNKFYDLYITVLIRFIECPRFSVPWIGKSTTFYFSLQSLLKDRRLCELDTVVTAPLLVHSTLSYVFTPRGSVSPLL